jgi:dienelactone hydrolase
MPGCPDCFAGHVHEGTAKGRTTKLYGLDVYVSEPPQGQAPKGIIVIMPDAYGWEFVNNRILADHYVEKGGYKVYLPDFMHGECPLIHEGDHDILTPTFLSFW